MNKKILFSLLFCIIFSFAVSARNKQKNTNCQAIKSYQPVAVEKEAKQKVYMHMMTWFGDKQTNIHPDPKYAGGWGVHWTMDTKNPDIIDAKTGKREIAAYYYPLTGPYSSCDKNIIEYQLLLMKLAGVDGIIFNYTTLNPAWDFPMLIAATDSIAKQTQKFGLDISIMYEDQHVRDAVSRNELTTDPLTRGKLDMQYIKDRYFSQPNYIKVSGRPILFDFGPQFFMSEDDWTTLFSVFGNEQPAFYALNYHNAAGKNEYGQFAWIWKDYLDGLRHFYNTYEYGGDKMGVAYPGFVTYYVEGGWAAPNTQYTIPHRGDSTLIETLDLALKSNVGMIQLATWNDYGEGTMFEPTVEFGFTFLSRLQKQLGVKNLTEKDLKLVFKLYTLRKKYANSAKTQAKLDKAVNYIASLQMDKAKKIIDAVK